MAGALVSPEGMTKKCLKGEMLSSNHRPSESGPSGRHFGDPVW